MNHKTFVSVFVFKTKYYVYKCLRCKAMAHIIKAAGIIFTVKHTNVSSAYQHSDKNQVRGNLRSVSIFASESTHSLCKEAF